MDIVSELRELTRNLWWIWQPNVIALFRDLDPSLWRSVNHNPIAFLSSISREALESQAFDLASEPRVSYAVHRLHEYLHREQSWSDIARSPLRARPVAYFSAEFGLHESIPIYSGGLGILAGDHLKSASDLGVPIIGVGLFYAQGYFHQHLDASGWQQESYLETEIDQLPLVRLLDPEGRPRILHAETRSSRIAFGLWLTQVGRSLLLLLDSGIEENIPEDRELVARLYGGDERVRIRQELLLGVGGMAALQALGIRPAVLHLNEGHSAFAVLEMARQEMASDEIDFVEAIDRVRRRTVFTTHTPVEAGHDRFGPDLLEETLGPLRDALGIAPQDLLALGRVHPEDPAEPFCMTVLGLKVARKTGGVSALHGQVTRRMWHSLWKDRSEAEVPIGHVTNGVHVASWLSPSMHQLFDSCLGAEWETRMCSPRTWTPIARLDDAELWEANQIAKARLIAFVERRLREQEIRREGTTPEPVVAKHQLHPEILTIGLARRFATYKRADLIMSDVSRLERLVCDSERPIQIIFAGKAHPRDEPGKALIQQIFRMSRDARFLGRVVLIEDYDINVARHLIQGVDLWLNAPRRPLEACGTSGMKAVFNGALNFSVLDGWWNEAYNGQNGFAIGTGGQHAKQGEQDARDAKDLYRVLETEILPLYYDRDTLGIPRGWLARVKDALQTLAWRFNADRMVMDYAREFYLPSIGGVAFDVVER